MITKMITTNQEKGKILALKEEYEKLDNQAVNRAAEYEQTDFRYWVHFGTAMTFSKVVRDLEELLK